MLSGRKFSDEKTGELSRISGTKISGGHHSVFMRSGDDPGGLEAANGLHLDLKTVSLKISRSDKQSYQTRLYRILFYFCLAKK